MTITHLLTELADDLDGAGWQTKFMEEWSESERKVAESALNSRPSSEAIGAYVAWLIREPVQVIYDDKDLVRIEHNGRAIWERTPEAHKVP